jgi:predicted RNase H-like nuclease (RuvC/YqgF family)
MATVDQKDEKGKKDKKVTLTISTLSGDYTHAFKQDEQLKDVVEETRKKLKLVGEGPWILEFNGSVLDQERTIEQVGLKDGDVLTLNPQEGGGGSGRQ